MNDLKKAVIKTATGDVEALAFIYRALKEDIFRFALSITGNYDDSEDILQDTIIKVKENADGYRGGDAKAWVLKITRNLSIDALRKNKRETPIEDEKLVCIADPWQNADLPSFKEYLELVEDCTDRQIIYLKIFTGLKFREIAELTGLSSDTAQKRYKRALERLKKAL